jgi:hypothetical protein
MYFITHQSRAVLWHRKSASDMIFHDRCDAQVSDKECAVYALHLSVCEQLARVKKVLGCNAMLCYDTSDSPVKTSVHLYQATWHIPQKAAVFIVTVLRPQNLHV